MKHTIFRRSLALLLVLSLCICFAVNVYSIPMFKIHLLGIIDSDGADRTSWQTDVQSSLSNIPYSTFFNLTAFDNDKLLTYLRLPDMFVIHTHGSQTTLKTVDESGTESSLHMDAISGLTAGALDSLDLAFIGACECGKGGSTASNIINAIYGRGARCVIGYQESVYTRANYIMIKEFSLAIGEGYTIAEALAYADTQVLAQYGSSGNTDIRLVRGDTSVSFVDTGTLLSVRADNLSENPDQSSNRSIVSADGMDVGYIDLSSISATNSNTYTTSFADPAIDLEKYTFVKQYFNEDTGVWTSVYTNFIDGIATEDSIFILHNAAGEIIGRIQPNPDLFNEFEFADGMLSLANRTFQNTLLEMDIDEYDLIECRLVMNCDIPALRYSIRYSIYSNEERYEVIDDIYVPVQ